ncbi:disease resistance protein RPM1 isoform X1 [Morus notabilis]|nr:disease resistance protein RPM1 isoform X1 [Morus notabilis]
MFPQHHSIRNGRLIREWIAEGFVKAIEGKTLEDVAHGYMNELINRSLVEAPELDVTGKAKVCRVHDLLHEIILKKTKEVGFCRVLPRSNEPAFRGINRRLSIMINSSNDDLQGNIFPYVHSVIVFRRDETLNNVVPVFGTSFKFLKVLDFEDAPCLDRLPDDIGNLFDLRYLSVRGTKVRMLPRSIEKLENLETLDLRNSLVYELPASETMKRLGKLRNIYALNIDHKVQRNGFSYGSRGIKVVGGIGFLKALQKLFYIEVDQEGDKDLFKELGNLTQLRTLGISNVGSEDWRNLCRCVENMKLLESLFVASSSESVVFDLELMSSPPKFLRNINLIGHLKTIPQWFTQHQSTLVKLRLGYSKLEEDHLQVLENMHNLSHLEICHDAYVGERLHFKKGVFPKLKKLHLQDLSRLCSLIIEESALVMIEQLFLGPFPQMKEVPSGLEHLKKLKTLVFHLMPPLFMISSDFVCVNHVQQVRFACRNNGQIEVISLPNLLKYKQDWIREKGEVQQGDSTSANTKDQHQDQ